MQHAVFAIVINCVVFAGVGLGPLTVLARGVGAGALLALSPAVGYALVSTALTCWLMREGTVGSAMLPLTGALGLLSLVCLWCRRGALCAKWRRIHWRRFWPGLAGLVFCLGLLTAPLAAGNTGYPVFRGNASDSFIYMFLAKYFEEHPRAWAFTHTPQEVVADDPLLGPPRSMLNIRWTSGAMLAYGAKLAGQGILPFQYPFTMTSFVILFAALLPFLAAMGLSPLWSMAGALALVTGFYGQLVLDIRAFSQINVLPLTVLLGWALCLPRTTGRTAALCRIGLLGLAFLACFVNYTEIFPMVVGASAAFVLLLAMVGRLSRRQGLVLLGGFALGMAATWPVRFLYGHMLAQIHFTEIAPQLWSDAYFSWLFHNIPAGIFGVTLLEDGFSRLPGLAFLHVPVPLVTLVAVLLALLCLVGAWRAMTDQKHDAPLVALAFAAASLAAFVLFTLKGKPWVAGKGLSYFYPFLLSLPLYAALSHSPLPAAGRLAERLKSLRPLTRTVAMLFLVLQFAFAGLRPVYAALNEDYPHYVRNHGRYRAIDCDVEPLTLALHRAKAKDVALCSADPWKWSFLGLLLDDTMDVRLPSQMLDGPAETPVFVILDHPAGGIPPELRPFMVAANATFVLYRLPRKQLAELVPSLSCNIVPY